jgi:hypothetical protein
MKMADNKEYTREPMRLASMLMAANIPHEVRVCWDGLQVCYPSRANSVSDAICHSGSYGHESGLLEIMGLVNEAEVGDSVEGWLTAEKVFERWHDHWLKTHGEEGE